MAGRFELKFLIDGELRQRLLDRCPEGLSFDRNARQGSYRVTSRYYDSPDFTAYWEKLDGVRVRRKFRLRYYGEEGPYAFEIKHRVDQIVFKERLALDPGAARQLLESVDLGDLEASLLSPESERSCALRRVLEADAEGRLRPVHFVSYLREAFVGQVDPRLRVTFDHECRALPPYGGKAVPLLPGGGIVAEVKFDATLPSWLRRWLLEVQLRPRRFSKYVAGVEAMGCVAGVPVP